MFSVTQIADMFRRVHHVEDRDLHHVPTRRNFKARGRALLMSHDGKESSRMRRRVGIDKEGAGLDQYEHLTGRRLSERNSRDLMVGISLSNGSIIRICGRVDGLVSTGDRIVEHKYRPNGLQNKVFLSEKVQCHLYMRMYEKNMVDLIETFGNHAKIHNIRFDPLLWKVIEQKLETITRCPSPLPTVSRDGR